MAAPKNNKYALGNNGGRPPVFETPDELRSAVDSYFTYIIGEFHIETSKTKNTDTGKYEVIRERVWDRVPEPATVTGFTLYLGFASRSSLDDYEKRNDEFSYIIKNGRLRVEHEYEKNLHGDKNAGSIFALKNMGWRDKQEVGFTDKEGEDLSSKTDEELSERLLQIEKAIAK